MDPPAFWVWHRSSPLASQEIAGLRTAGTKSLYWQAVECGWKDQRWQPVRIAAPMPEPTGLSIIPVFRIKPDATFLQDPASAKQFARMIQLWSDEKVPQEIQIDFDCPDRLLGRYAEFLTQLGGELTPTKISITALASWPRHSGFKKLAASVRSMAPMFYDLHADMAAEAKSSKFRALADNEDIALIQLWTSCPVPWLAGLPNFERLSLFHPDGSLSGHLRGWNHDEVFFNRKLIPNPLGNGITSYRIDSLTEIAGTSLPAGSQLIHRMPDATALGAMERTAEKAGAQGIIYFALPGPGIQATFSPTHLAAPTSLPGLTLRLSEDGSVQLTNTGTADLAARPCDPTAPLMPGWRLELTGKSGSFIAGSPGQFARMTIPGHLPPEISASVILHFSKLPAGQSLTSTPIIKDSAGLQWTLHPYKEDESVKSP